nr:unnamed protein product [Callosobruchus chinensis]
MLSRIVLLHECPCNVPRITRHIYALKQDKRRANWLSVTGFTRQTVLPADSPLGEI